jgi:hypothetical protein
MKALLRIMVQQWTWAACAPAPNQRKAASYFSVVEGGGRPMVEIGTRIADWICSEPAVFLP